MFDFGDLLKKDSLSADKSYGLKSVLFYRDEQCRTLVSETFRFDGFSQPDEKTYSVENVVAHLNENDCEFVIVDLLGCKDTVEASGHLANIIQTSASVVIVGDEDSIATVRKLKEFGFYYVFWPVSKEELSEFLVSVVKRHVEETSIKGRRKAKRVGIFGTKGGVGCSLIAAELAWTLSSSKHTSCTLVNHNYCGGNIDILLGKKNLGKRTISQTDAGRNLDKSSAKSLLVQVEPRMHYLALGVEDETSEEIHQVNEIVIDLISSESNFVVDDFSASVNFDISPQWLYDKLDVLVVVMEPTISSLRDTAILLNELKKRQQEQEDDDRSVRIVVLLNHHRAPRLNTVNLDEIHKYLVCPIDINLPYELSIAEHILHGSHISSGRTKLAAQIQRLASLIMGEEVKAKPKLSKRLFWRKKT